MRKFYCLKCGKSINTSAQGPFYCVVHQAGIDKSKPKVKGTSG